MVEFGAHGTTVRAFEPHESVRAYVAGTQPAAVAARFARQAIAEKQRRPRSGQLLVNEEVIGACS